MFAPRSVDLANRQARRSLAASSGTQLTLYARRGGCRVRGDGNSSVSLCMHQGRGQRRRLLDNGRRAIYQLTTAHTVQKATPKTNSTEASCCALGCASALMMPRLHHGLQRSPWLLHTVAVAATRRLIFADPQHWFPF
eukprot:2487071-Pleurochrysis_carterae.AAC.2